MKVIGLFLLEFVSAVLFFKPYLKRSLPHMYESEKQVVC